MWQGLFKCLSMPHSFCEAQQMLGKQAFTILYAFEMSSFPLKFQTPTPSSMVQEDTYISLSPTVFGISGLSVDPCTNVIKLHFLSLVCLMSVWFLDELGEPWRVEENSSAPTGAKQECLLQNDCQRDTAGEWEAPTDSERGMKTQTGPSFEWDEDINP